VRSISSLSLSLCCMEKCPQEDSFCLFNFP
jgi:hypothetical protein